MDFIVLDELGYLPFAQSGGQKAKEVCQPTELHAAGLR
jgi:hypothetical protein